MKKNILFTGTLLGLTASALVFSACSRPSERPSVMDKTITDKVFAMKDLGEITANTVYFANAEDPIAKANASVKQVKIEGKIQDLLKKVKNAATKKALDDQLKSGSIAIVILNDQLKVLKIVADTELTTAYDVISLKYIGRLKELSKTPEVKAQADTIKELESLKYTSPKSANEKYGMVEITTLKIDKAGVLDNVKNDYDEKKSILTVQEKPFGMSTHIVVSDEISTSTGQPLDPPTPEDIAAAKAAADFTK